MAPTLPKTLECPFYRQADYWSYQRGATNIGALMRHLADQIAQWPESSVGSIT